MGVAFSEVVLSFVSGFLPCVGVAFSEVVLSFVSGFLPCVGVAFSEVVLSFVSGCLCVLRSSYLRLKHSRERGNGAVVVGTKPGLAAVGSATVAVLSQSSGIERPFSLP